MSIEIDKRLFWTIIAAVVAIVLGLFVLGLLYALLVWLIS